MAESDADAYFEQIYARLDVHCARNVCVDRVLIWGFFPCDPTITHDSIGIRSTCSDGLKITNCTIMEVRDGISIHDSSNVEISDSRIFHVGRDGINTLRVNGIKITHNMILDFCPNYMGVEANNPPANYDHADCIQLTNTSNISISNNDVGISPWLDESNSAWTQSIFIHEERNQKALTPRCTANCRFYVPYDIHQSGTISIKNNYINNRHLHGITVKGHCNDIVDVSQNTLRYAGVYPNPTVVSIPSVNIEPPC